MQFLEWDLQDQRGVIQGKEQSEAGEAETSQRAAFEQRYGPDLRAKADHIALEHPRPLSIRGLVDRWQVDYVYAKSFPGAGDPGWLKHRPLDTYETKALLGWCRREMEGACMPGVFAGAVAESGLGGEREVLAYYIGKKLGGPFEPGAGGWHRRALELCNAAGWPR